MFLSYDPDNFLIDFRYLIGNHSSDLIAFTKTKFKNNADNIEIKKTDLSKLYINNQSNIYSNEVWYDKQFDWLDQKKNEQATLEKYANQNGMALLWSFIENEIPVFKALHSSEFFIENDYLGKLKSVIVKAGSFYDEVGNLQSLFLTYDLTTKRIYKAISQSWSMLPKYKNEKNETKEIKIELWDLYNEEFDGAKEFDVLPFTLFTKDGVIQPYTSDLIAIENMMTASLGYAEMTILISFLKKVFLTSNLNDADFDDFADKFGINFKMAKLPTGSEINFLDTGSVTNQLDYQTFFNNFLYLKANADGVDRYAVFPDLKVESGVSRAIQMKNIEQIRNSNIVLWKKFEQNNFKVLQNLRVQTPSQVFYQKNIIMSEMDVVDIEIKKYDLLERKYQGGVITKVELIMRSEDMSEQDAIHRITKAQKEREESEEIENNEMTNDVQDENENNNTDVNDDTDNNIE